MVRSEGGEAGRGGNATLIALITNHLRIAVDSPVWTPAEEENREKQKVV